MFAWYCIWLELRLMHIMHTVWKSFVVLYWSLSMFRAVPVKEVFFTQSFNHFSCTNRKFSSKNNFKYTIFETEIRMWLTWVKENNKLLAHQFSPYATDANRFQLSFEVYLSFVGVNTIMFHKKKKPKSKSDKLK